MMLSWPKLLILIAVVALLFGTKRLRTLGSDLGAAIKGFKKEMEDDNKNSAEQYAINNDDSNDLDSGKHK